MTVTLNYVCDDEPGITRHTGVMGFEYYYPDGRRVRSRAVIRRIHALAIPPAYADVWICRDPQGHIQATGRDAKGRKQYRYHREWDALRNETKYGRMLSFGKALPRIRRRVSALLKDGTPREKVLAAVVRLLELTLIRVGNDEYARKNKSYGLTTLRARHVEVSAAKIHLGFRGKGGIEHRITVEDEAVARIVKACQNLPGPRLFQYRDDNGRCRTVTAADVNAFLREIAGADFSAKDYRTWAGSVLAMSALRQLHANGHMAKKGALAVVKAVAERLGNTPSVCRKAYIHPALLDPRLARTLASTNGCRGPRRDEAAFLRFLSLVNGSTLSAIRSR